MHDKNQPESWSFLEISYDIKAMENIPQSAELLVEHKVGEKPTIQEETKFKGDELQKKKRLEGTFQSIKYYTDNEKERSKYEQNLLDAKTFHKNEINLEEPIVNYSRPHVNEDSVSSVLRDDSSTTGPKTSRRTSTVNTIKTRKSKFTKDSHDVYKIPTKMSNSNCYGKRGCPYKLYQRDSDSSKLNKHSSVISQKDLKKYDPQLYDSIMNKINQENKNGAVDTPQMWKHIAHLVGKEREGSTDGSSLSHSITIVRTGKRSEGNSPRSLTGDSPRSPLKQEESNDFIYATEWHG